MKILWGRLVSVFNLDFQAGRQQEARIMFVEYKGTIFGLARWQWKPLLIFVLVSTGIVVGHQFYPKLVGFIEIPSLPLGVVGGAIGIFTSFRTNSAYQRWWEGRQLWGRLVNSSRHFCTQVLAYLPMDEGDRPSELQKRLVRRQILYVHMLRCLLRKQDPWADQEVRRYVKEADVQALRAQSSIAHAILHEHAKDIAACADAGKLEPLRLKAIDETLANVLDVQGGCERIKNTPFPRGYGFIAERLIWAFGWLLPLGLVESAAWATIPITVLVCMSFLLIGEVGRVLEDPFTMFWPALPLSALSTTIEANLLDRLGETEVPALHKPNEQGILM